MNFQYDETGRRIHKRTGNTLLTSIWSDGKIVYETDGTPANDLSYRWGENGLQAYDKGGKSYASTTSWKGDIFNFRLTNSTAAANNVIYDAFGRDMSGVTATPFGYNSEYTDFEIGLQYLGSRYYSPGLGRFTQEDSALGNHPYVYCNNDPVNGIDPSGHYAPGDTVTVNGVNGGYGTNNSYGGDGSTTYSYTGKKMRIVKIAAGRKNAYALSANMTNTVTGWFSESQIGGAVGGGGGGSVTPTKPEDTTPKPPVEEDKGGGGTTNPPSGPTYDVYKPAKIVPTVELGIHTVAFGPLKTTEYHSCLIITVPDGSYFKSSYLKNITSNGDRYMTIGAGPGLKWLVNYVKAEYNRPADVKLGIKLQRISLVLDDKQFDSLIKAANNFMRNYSNKIHVEYDYFPNDFNDSYNSNSFIRGLLMASGYNTGEIPLRYILEGWGRPIPVKYFT